MAEVPENESSDGKNDLQVPKGVLLIWYAHRKKLPFRACQMWARQLNDIDRNSQPLSNPDPTGKEREFFEALRKGIATDRKHVCY